MEDKNVKKYIVIGSIIYGVLCGGFFILGYKTGWKYCSEEACKIVSDSKFWDKIFDKVDTF